MYYALHLLFFLLELRIASEGNTSKEVAKAGKDPFWDHSEKVGIKVRCRFCDHKVSGGISRLKQHLAHERGNCAPCPNVTPDVKAKARAAVDALKSTKVPRKLGCKVREMRYKSGKRPLWCNHVLNLTEVCFKGVALVATKE